MRTAGDGRPGPAADAPELVLEDVDGAEFRLSSLRGWNFNARHRLQPDNRTYRRRARSLVSRERAGQAGIFAQDPVEGEDDDWPFESDFSSQVCTLPRGGALPADAVRGDRRTRLPGGAGNDAA